MKTSLNLLNFKNPLLGHLLREDFFRLEAQETRYLIWPILGEFWLNNR